MWFGIAGKPERQLLSRVEIEEREWDGLEGGKGGTRGRRLMDIKRRRRMESSGREWGKHDDRKEGRTRDACVRAT